MRTVATAGHVDHGKSSLVLALTGTDPDRFPEEKTRGLTIDLGFAFTTLPSGTEIAFVDVPGHVRFIKNMLAGVGAVDVAVLVVAANEGWMPQSEEHVRILELLGIEHGVVALTKADVVDDETFELAQLELEDRLASTPFARAPVVAVDSRSGRGLDDLRAALDAVLADAPPVTNRDRPRLWIDRVFAAKGAGTVVTGTLVGGPLAVDDEVVVVPGDRRVRIRGIESRHQKLTRIGPGTRVALNLAGVEHTQLARGDAVVRAEQWRPTTVVDVAVSLLPDEHLPPRARLQAYAGSGEHTVVYRATRADARFARLRLPSELPLAPGDRLVLRDPGSSRTVAGAEVRDVAPVGRWRHAVARLALPLGERLLAARPWLPLDQLRGPLTGLSPHDADVLVETLVADGIATRLGTNIVATDELATLRKRAVELAVAHHREHPLDPGLELNAFAAAFGLDVERARLVVEAEETLSLDRGAVRHTSHRGSASDDPEAQRLLAALDAAAFSPPSAAEVGVEPAVARALVRDGLAVDLDGVLFTSAALDRARELVVDAIERRGAITVADARDVLGSTRKYVLPLLNRLDAEGVTRRRGDERILGPVARQRGETSR
ncbi:MAG TPA: selenocysteine-specific translation elongation factor [Acidimicrobiia bacterium]|nr:selenocysteine-specific translation elongation factor [Acidimicrobiia bacterium]